MDLNWDISMPDRRRSPPKLTNGSSVLVVITWAVLAFVAGGGVGGVANNQLAAQQLRGELDRLNEAVAMQRIEMDVIRRELASLRRLVESQEETRNRKRG